MSESDEPGGRGGDGERQGEDDSFAEVMNRFTFDSGRSRRRRRRAPEPPPEQQAPAQEPFQDWPPDQQPGRLGDQPGPESTGWHRPLTVVAVAMVALAVVCLVGLFVDPRVLTGFHEKLSAKALQALTSLGVEVLFDAHVTAVTPTAVEVTSDLDKSVRRIETRTVVWAAGVRANPLGKKLVERLGATAAVDRGGRVGVAPDCTVPGHPDYFILGDMMSLNRLPHLVPRRLPYQQSAPPLRTGQTLSL